MLTVWISAAGSPGVTTTTLAAATAWPRPALVIEADAAGASPILAGYFCGQLPHDRGLMALVRADRAGALDEALTTVPLPLAGSAAAVVPGLSSVAQADAAMALWPSLVPALRQLRSHVDVLVDAGRLGNRHEPTPLLAAADTVVVLVRPTLPAVAVTRSRLRALTTLLPAIEQRLALLIVGTGAYGPKEIAATLDVPLLGVVAWDPGHAASYSEGAPSRRLAGSRLMHSVRRVVTQLTSAQSEPPGAVAGSALPAPARGSVASRSDAPLSAAGWGSP